MKIQIEFSDHRSLQRHTFGKSSENKCNEPIFAMSVRARKMKIKNVMKSLPSKLQYVYLNIYSFICDDPNSMGQLDAIILISVRAVQFIIVSYPRRKCTIKMQINIVPLFIFCHQYMYACWRWRGPRMGAGSRATEMELNSRHNQINRYKNVAFIELNVTLYWHRISFRQWLMVADNRKKKSRTTGMCVVRVRSVTKWRASHWMNNKVVRSIEMKNYINFHFRSTSTMPTAYNS